MRRDRSILSEKYKISSIKVYCGLERTTALAIFSSLIFWQSVTCEVLVLTPCRHVAARQEAPPHPLLGFPWLELLYMIV